MVSSTAKAWLHIESLETAKLQREMKLKQNRPFPILLLIVSLSPFLKLTKSPASEGFFSPQVKR